MMEVREYRSVDKSSWGPGPWQDEPDKRQWQDPATGLPCLIVRGPMGAWCGYVGVPRGHPYYKVSYHDLPDDIEVHGGITFSNHCDPRPQAVEHGICHIPGEGESDDVWWLGFDCAHAFDYMPGMDPVVRRVQDKFPELHALDTYRDIAWVSAEVERLAAELHRHA